MARDEEGSSECRVVATLSEIDAGQMIARKIGDVQIALYNVGGNIFATDNVYTHAYALLTDGWLDDAVVACPLHGGQFNVCTGKAICTPAEVDLQTYPVRDSSVLYLETRMEARPFSLGRASGDR